MAMENALREVLTRAQRWGAVMLIDEADVYSATGHRRRARSLRRLAGSGTRRAETASAHIPLSIIGIDHIHDFGRFRPKSSLSRAPRLR